MRVIDLLNKIANGEEVPRKFKYENITFIYNGALGEYFDEKEGNSFNYTFDITDYVVLNDEVEIIEEDEKIEKLDQRTDTGLFGSQIKNEIEVANTINKQANYISNIVCKINEIIDYINKGDKE